MQVNHKCRLTPISQSQVLPPAGTSLIENLKRELLRDLQKSEGDNSKFRFQQCYCNPLVPIPSAQSELADSCRQTNDHCILDDILKTNNSCWLNEDRVKICCCCAGKGILQESKFGCCCRNTNNGEQQPSSRQRRADVNFCELPPDICMADCAPSSKIEMINTGRSKTATLFQRCLPHVSSHSLYAKTNEENNQAESEDRECNNNKKRKKRVKKNKEICESIKASARSPSTDSEVRRTNENLAYEAKERGETIRENAYDNKENSLTYKKSTSPPQALRSYPSRYHGEIYRLTRVGCGNRDRKKSSKSTIDFNIGPIGGRSEKAYKIKNRKQARYDEQILTRKRNELNGPELKFKDENSDEYGTEFNEVKKQNKPLKEAVNRQDETKRKSLFSCCRRKKKSSANETNAQNNDSDAIPQSNHIVSEQTIEKENKSPANEKLSKEKDCFLMCCKKRKQSKKQTIPQMAESDADNYGEIYEPHLENGTHDPKPDNFGKSECYCDHCKSINKSINQTRNEKPSKKKDCFLTCCKKRKQSKKQTIPQMSESEAENYGEINESHVENGIHGSKPDNFGKFECYCDHCKSINKSINQTRNEKPSKKKDCFLTCCKKRKQSKKQTIPQMFESDAENYGERYEPHLQNGIHDSKPDNFGKSECYCDHCKSVKQRSSIPTEIISATNSALEFPRNDSRLLKLDEQNDTVNHVVELEKPHKNGFLKKGKESLECKCYCRKKDTKCVYHCSEDLEVQKASLTKTRPKESDKVAYKTTSDAESDYREVLPSPSSLKNESTANMVGEGNFPLNQYDIRCLPSESVTNEFDEVKSNNMNVYAKSSDKSREPEPNFKQRSKNRKLDQQIRLEKAHVYKPTAQSTTSANLIGADYEDKQRSKNRKPDQQIRREETHVYKPTVPSTTSFNSIGTDYEDGCSCSMYKQASESDCSCSDNENRLNLMENTYYANDPAVNNTYQSHIKPTTDTTYIPLENCVAKYSKVKRNGLQIPTESGESHWEGTEINQGRKYEGINYGNNCKVHHVDVCCCSSDSSANKSNNSSGGSFIELHIDLDECDSSCSSHSGDETYECAQLPQVIEISEDVCDYCHFCQLKDSNNAQNMYSNSLNNRTRAGYSPPISSNHVLVTNDHQSNKKHRQYTKKCSCFPFFIRTSVKSCEQKKNFDQPDKDCSRQRKSLLNFCTAQQNLLSAGFSKYTKQNQTQTDKWFINSEEKASIKTRDRPNSTPSLNCEEGPKNSVKTLAPHCNRSGFVGNMPADNECIEKDCCVRVAVRIRPQNSREKIDMCRVCTAVTPGEPQVILGQDKAFTFDYVFDADCNQNDIYSECVKRLVEGALRGYNATVLAYGQTGSGKTFTMGTGFERSIDDDQKGIIPRAVEYIFAGIESIQSPRLDENSAEDLEEITFSVAVQFMELYNEDIIDLLDPYSKGNVFKIHEDSSGQISVSGVTIKPIQTPQDALKCLQQGALARTTASTQMNDQSSRSHALFTILIRRQRLIKSGLGLPGDDIETLTSKFHFVDLAGSERLKRTGATGERAREGISINCGLLALGNCISALGDKTKKATHIPYRDSKLTRLLQDSLGGNSQTLMIACVSPSDRDFMETLNTLKYANRTRNIKNKVQINQDQSSRTICQLRREIAALQMELLEYKQGKRCIDPEGNSSLTDTCHENAMLMADNRRLQQRLKAMQETINVLTERNVQLKLKVETHGLSSLIDTDQTLTTMVAGYLSEIEKLQAKLIESEEMYQQLKKNNAGTPRSMTKVKIVSDDPEDVINLAKKDLEKNREVLMSRSLPGFQDTSRSDVDPDNLCETDDSDSESDDKTNDIEADLNDINSDIEIKSKLIEQLELSQQRMQLMRQHYEEKLNVLNCKIVNTQKERDEVLATMGPHNGNQPNDKMKKVKDEYERKINEMQRELRKLQQAEREHARQQRALKAQEFKLANLRTELCELKCIKTKLIRKMSEQTNRHKEEENRRTREIAQLRKEQRRQENTVKSLQAKMNAKDQILKRKTEEVSALRRSQRGSLSRKAAGRLASKHDRNVFNARLARQQWENLNRAITHASRNKQVVLQLEKELERLMNERETLSHDLANICSRQTSSKNIDLANEEDTIKSNLNYIQDNISQLQQAIMEFEEGKDSIKNDSQAIQMFVGQVQNVDEAKFLLEKLIDNTVMFSCNSAMIQNRLLEHEALLKEMQQESTIQQQLLQHFLAQNNAVQISDLFESLNLYGTNVNINNLNGSQKSLASNGTYDIPSNRNISDLAQQNVRSRSSSPTPTFDLSLSKNVKIRRRTAQPQDLLFGDKSGYDEDNAMTHSFTQRNSSLESHIPLMRIPSAPESLRQSFNSSAVKMNTELSSSGAHQSPRLNRHNIVSKGPQKADDDASNTRTRSPPVYGRTVSREDTNNGANDVFSRLAAGIQDPLPGGYIQKVNAKNRIGVPLYCTHIVSGHNKAVLSMQVDENILYTAAADRTVKVWDLSHQSAQHCLSTHLGPVIAIQNDRNTRLLFSASGPYVRVWDLRGSNSKPIKTLSSSGLLLHGNTNIAGIAPGESPITALCLGPSGNLYVASSDKVRIWEIKSLACIGKLSGGHQAAVMCVTSWSGKDNKTDFVATGSKDHYVKVFEVPKFGGTVSPLLNLEPPHYDGVQSLSINQDAVGTNVELFSGSRDSGIKQWDLQSGELQQSLNNAHKGWVTGMAIAGNTLISTCRGGVIRLWNAKTCESLAEMKTDLMINDIVTSNQRVFIASGSGEVRIYRFTSQENLQISNIKTPLGKIK